jgi:hypothetical protein
MVGISTADTMARRLALEVHDRIHIGIDVGGRREKRFDLCITEWVGGTLKSVEWKRIPHVQPMPPTSALRSLVAAGDIGAFADVTQTSASATAVALWQEIQRFGPTGIHIDSPSGFSRDVLGHGRLCEKLSLTEVSFQSTRECFPTATISVLRTRKRETDVVRCLASQVHLPEVQTILQYLKWGVRQVKRPADALYDRADALVAGLGALPHVAEEFREVLGCLPSGGRWSGIPGDEQREGSFA